MSFVFASKDGSGDITDSSGSVVSFSSAEQAAQWAEANGVSPDLFDIEEVGSSSPADTAKSVDAALPVINQNDYAMSSPISYVARDLAKAAFPRTSEAAMKGETMPILSGLLDVASLPGRSIASALDVWGSASDPNFKGISKGLESSLAKTEGSSDFLPLNVAETVVRDPLSIILPVASSLSTKLLSKTYGQASSRAGMLAREAARVASESGTAGVIGGQSDGGTFSPSYAVGAAVPGSVLGAKSVADAPANIEVMRRLSRPEIVSSIYGELKPGTPTFRRANPTLNDMPTFERIMFKGDEYGAPAMSSVSENSAYPWEDVLNALENRVENIGTAQKSAIKGSEFSTRVPGEMPLLKMAAKPSDRYSSGDILRSDLNTQELNLKVPFSDVFDRIQGRGLTDEGVINDVYSFMSGKSSGPNQPINSISISDLIELKRVINRKRKDLGGYKTPEASDLSNAYKDAYDAINDVIKHNLPETKNTRDYYAAEKAFAESIPLREGASMRIRGALGSNKPRDQTELGRLNIVLENPSNWRAGVRKALVKDLPPKVDVRNAQQLYNESPQLIKNAERQLTQGSSPMPVLNVSRYMPRFSEIINRANEDKK